MPILTGGLAAFLLAVAPGAALPHATDLPSSAATVQQLGDADTAHGAPSRSASHGGGAYASAAAASSVQGLGSIGHDPRGTIRPLRRIPGSPAATSDMASFATADRKPQTDDGGLKKEKASRLEGFNGGLSAA